MDTDALRAQARASPAPGAAPWPWRVAAGVATAAAAALLGTVIAVWGWRWWGPEPAPAPTPKIERWAAVIAEGRPFGRAGAAPPAVADAVPVSSDVRLVGVLAERNGGGYALFQRERGAVLIRVGEAIAAGITLVAVRPDGVSIRDHGELREVALRSGAARNAPDAPLPASRAATPGPATAPIAAPPAAPAPAPLAPSSAGPPAAAPAPPRVAAAAGAACTVPAGYRGVVYRLNAELLTGVAARPDSWAGFVAPVPGGLAVRDEAGFASMLGMKSGDLMSQANGIALTRAEDVVVAFINPLLASQPVHVLGTRNGKAADWVFLNAGACPG